MEYIGVLKIDTRSKHQNVDTNLYLNMFIKKLVQTSEKHLYKKHSNISIFEYIRRTLVDVSITEDIMSHFLYFFHFCIGKVFPRI